MVTGNAAAPSACVTRPLIGDGSRPPRRGSSERTTTSGDGTAVDQGVPSHAPEVTGTLRLIAAMNAASPRSRSRIIPRRIRKWSFSDRAQLTACAEMQRNDRDCHEAIHVILTVGAI